MSASHQEVLLAAIERWVKAPEENRFGWTVSGWEGIQALCSRGASGRVCEARKRLMLAAWAGCRDVSAPWVADLGTFGRPSTAAYDLQAELRRCDDAEEEGDVLVGERLCAHEVEWIFEKVRRGEYNVDGSFGQRFPPLTDTDLAIRRIRFDDVVAAFAAGGRLRRFEGIFRSLGQVHYGLALGLLVHDIMCWGRWKHTPLLQFARSSMGFVRRAGKLTTGLKTSSTAPAAERALLCEGQMLFGYRNLPAAQYNDREAFDGLAKAGAAKFELAGDFSVAVRQMLASAALPAPVEFVSFSDWVEQGLWVTSGSIGSVKVGQIEWAGEGADGRARMRKNMVPYSLEVEEAVDMAMSENGQHFRVFVKCEAGKWRLAVAGSFGAYLIAAYVLWLSNKFYLRWEGNTMDENAQQTIDRLIATRDALAGNFSLPFDYEKFDHQPELSHVLELNELIIENARANVPQGRRGEFDDIARRCRMSLTQAYYTYTTQKGIHLRAQYAGGVPSGDRRTSVIGNGWNTVMTGKVLAWIRNHLHRLDATKRYIRGDDSQFISDNWVFLSVIKTVFDGFGVASSDTKVSTLAGNSEFLRIWSAPEGNLGYVCRSILGVLTRKPWTDDQVSPFSGLTSALESLEACRRRWGDGPGCNALSGAIKTTFCAKKRLDRRWLQVPTNLGGLGIEPSAGWVPDCSLPLDRSSIAATVTSSWAPRRFRKVAQKLGFDVSDAEAHSAAEAELVELLKAGDYADLARDMRRTFDRLLGDLRPRWRRVHWEQPRLARQRGERSGAWLSGASGQRGMWQGAGRTHLEHVRMADTLERVRGGRRGGSVGWLREHAPTTWAQVRAVEERYGFRRREAIDWVIEGALPSGGMLRCHPLATNCAGAAVVQAFELEAARRRRRRVDGTVAVVARYNCWKEAAVWVSLSGPHQELLQW